MKYVCVTGEREAVQEAGTAGAKALRWEVAGESGRMEQGSTGLKSSRRAGTRSPR